MIEINQTEAFRRWLHKLKDPLGKVGILARIKRAQGGNFGDHKPLANTGGIYEMRIFKGNGYLCPRRRYGLLVTVRRQQRQPAKRYC
tara:strand:+ start:4486 stop:4746 length:261 start_codon:yes stop_codon:yes gene_type:complete